MQLVVMAAMLALAEAGQGCGFDCHQMNVSIPVESCDIIEPVYTTICAGYCYHRERVHFGTNAGSEYNICNGDWSDEVKYIKGCPVGVTYPVARNCRCTRCDPASTHCGSGPRNIASCLSFKRTP